MFDRYIDNRILQCLKRPQRKYECSITSLASAANALYKTDLSADDVLIATGWTTEFVTNGNVGNEDMRKAYKKMFPKGSAKILRTLINNVKDWSYLKKQIKKNKNALILHIDNHYNLIAGYFEEPISHRFLEKKIFSKTTNSLIMADQSQSRDPIWLLEYDKLLRKIRASRYYGIIRLSSR